MKNFDERAAGPDAGSASTFSWGSVALYFRHLRTHYRLLYVIVPLFMLIAVGVYFFSKQQYTAVAIIGPPPPSPVDAMMSGAGGATGSTSANFVKRIMGGGGTPSSNDPFQEYLQLLQSVRLVDVLIQKDHILQILYAKQWDAKNHRWRPPGMLESTVMGFNRMTGRPSSGVPNADSVMKFFKKNLAIETANKSRGTQGSSFLSDTSYPSVSLTFTDAAEAQQLLNVILLEADNLIREDMESDVSARLYYLNQELPKVTNAYERDTLIQVLSEQEQMETMLKSDKRFASTLIDPPYASDIPTWPSPLPSLLFAALAFAFAVWAVLVYLAMQFRFVSRLLVRTGGVVHTGKLATRSVSYT